MNPETIVDLQDSVYDWQLYNFGEQDRMLTLLGIYEEAGELCHAQLKKEQGIRGTDESLDAEMMDAVGDIMIYTMNFLSAIGKRITIYRSDFDHSGDTHRLRQAVALVFRCASRIDADDRDTTKVDQMVIALASLCAFKGWNLEKIVRDTWSQNVGLRDWKRFPETGKEG